MNKIYIKWFLQNFPFWLTLTKFTPICPICSDLTEISHNSRKYYCEFLFLILSKTLQDIKIKM